MRQSSVPAGDGPSFDWASDHVFVKTSAELTGGKVTIVEDTLKPGFHLLRHHHKQMFELFYILSGEVVFTFDDETVVGTTGMMINVPPNVRHDVRSDLGGKLLTVFTPGGFDNYLSACAAMTLEQAADVRFNSELAQRFDIWAD